MKIVFLLLMSLQISAQVVTNPWVKAAPPGLKMSAAYMDIKNDTKKDIYLKAVKTTIAEHPELHTHTEMNGVMKMRQVKNIVIKPSQTVSLKPKSFHIMLIQLTRNIKAGERIKLNLIFSNKKVITVLAPVKKI